MPYVKLQIKQEKLDKIKDLIPPGKSGVEVMNNQKKFYQEVFDKGMALVLGEADPLPHTPTPDSTEEKNDAPNISGHTITPGAFGKFDFYT